MKNKKNPKVDHFLDKSSKWKEEMTLLRDIVCSNEELEEDYKWMHPCYTLEGKNVVLIHGFKEYCALLFFKGALLKDPEGILVQQTENVQSARQIRFTEVSEIIRQESSIKEYVRQAVDVEKSGLKVVLKKDSEYPVPEEFQKILNENADLQKAFKALTPGRQRAYLFHFSQAKQAKTREARIEKYISQILSGKGMDD